MKLNQVTLSAFGSFADEITIDFRPVQGGLFLISGDTGAGKTTILDGISYALFGETSGGVREGVMMRSQYADEQTETFVEVEFVDHGSEYRVRRNPPYTHLGKRKSKDGTRREVKEQERVTLMLPDGTEFRGKKAETDAKIIEILGIDAKQFSSIAMIAQGKFTQLLFAPSKERREIFARLFDTDIYGKLQDELEQEATCLEEQIKALDIRYQESLRQIKTLSGDRSVNLPEEVGAGADGTRHLHESMETMLTCLRDLIQELEQETDKRRQDWKTQNQMVLRQQEMIRQIISERQWIEKREEAKKRLKQLEKEEEEILYIRDRMKRVEQARDLKAYYDAWKEKETESLKQQEELKACRKRQEELTEEIQKLQNVQKEFAEDMQVQLQGLEEDLNLESKMDQYRELKKAVREKTEIEQKTDALQRQLEEIKQQKQMWEEKRQISDQEYQRLMVESAKLQDYQRQYEICKKERDALQSLAEELTHWATKAKERDEKRQRIQHRETRWQRAKKDYEEAFHSYISHQAGILAEQLTEGEPCPVCGSRIHPQPAKCLGETLTREELDQIKSEQDRMEQDCLKEIQDYQTWKEHMKLTAFGLVKRGRELEIKDWMDVDERTWSFQDCDIETWRHERDILCKKALEEKEQLCQEQERNQRRAAQAELSLEENRIESERLKQSLLDAQEKEQSDQAQLLEYRDRRVALETLIKQIETQLPCGEEEAKEKLHAAKAKQEELQSTWETYQLKYQKCREEEVRMKGMETAKQTETERLKLEWLEKKARFDEEWKHTDFQNLSDFQIFQEDIPQLEIWNEKIHQHDLSLREANTDYRTAWEQVGDKESPALEPLEKQCEEGKKAEDELETQWREADRMLQGDRDILRNLQEICQEHRNLEQKYMVYQTLNKTANGKLSGKAKLDFQTYIQRYYFEQMIHAANARLADMTNGTLFLQCRSLEGLQRKGEAGLDLDVYSAELNQVRDVKTLSGGEAFQAALAMALGMSDVIQRTVGKVQIDTLFIDEGFGSLDEDARRMAVEKLRSLTGTTRMVGIISHVAELREEIPQRLLVTKAKKGSRADWV